MTITELKRIEALFLSKLPEGSEIDIEGQHDIIYLNCYKQSRMNELDFLTEQEIEGTDSGLHFDIENSYWAVFT